MIIVNIINNENVNHFSLELFEIEAEHFENSILFKIVVKQAD